MQNKMIDSHVHAVALKDYDQDVILMINSIKQQDIDDLLQLQRINKIYTGLGTHPMYAQQFNGNIGEINILIENKQVFIGEVGIDMRADILLETPLLKQLEVFKYYCELGFKYKRLISMHLINRSPGCLEQILDIFKELERIFGGTFIVFHAYQCSVEQFLRFKRSCNKCTFFIGRGWLNAQNIKLHKLNEFALLETDMYDEKDQNWQALWMTAKSLNNEFVQLNQIKVLEFLNQ